MVYVQIWSLWSTASLLGAELMYTLVRHGLHHQTKRRLSNQRRDKRQDCQVQYVLFRMTFSRSLY